MDEELERLKRRRMLELQRKMLSEKKESKDRPVLIEQSPKELLDQYFYGRAWEVYNAAKAQFPKIIPQIEKALVGAIKKGTVRERIDGESLYLFFRQLGLSVRLKTKIRYKEHGELKTIGQKFKDNK